MLSNFFKKSIWSKVFIMNLLILVFIVIVQLLFQSVFFEKYYKFKKEKQVKSEVTEFKDYLNKEFSKGSENYKNVMEYIQNVNKKTGINLVFRSKNLYDGIFVESYMNNSYIPIVDKNSGEKYKVILGDFFSHIKVGKNDNIKVYGAVDRYGYIIPYKLYINDVEVQSYYAIQENSGTIPFAITQASTVREGAFFTETFIDGTSIGEAKKEGDLLQINYLDIYSSTETLNNILSNESYTTILKNNNNNGEAIVSSLSANGGFIIGISPLTEVNDVISTMDSYYFIVFGIALVFVGVISLVYSKVITRPLIEMSRVAKEISKSNFNIKYPVKTKDEIGVLGASLNSISKNLKKSLKDLKISNNRLQKEMNLQKLQEEKRKELIANISHELKTPITIVQGSIEGLKKGIYTEEIYNDILEETTRMNDLVIEMLEISKLEGPSFKLDKEAFDLYSLTLKEMDKLKTLVNEKELNISLEVNVEEEDDEVVVNGDEKRVGEVLRNLITNAIKYTQEKENIKISIEDYEDKYKFTIENFGVTLNENELENIWEPFYRKEKSRNKKFGGTGLGLYIVKRILELHESEYGAKSNDNSVIFYFTLEKAEI